MQKNVYPVITTHLKLKNTYFLSFIFPVPMLMYFLQKSGNCTFRLSVYPDVFWWIRGPGRGGGRTMQWTFKSLLIHTLFEFVIIFLLWYNADICAFFSDLKKNGDDIYVCMSWRTFTLSYETITKFLLSKHCSRYCSI